MGKSNAIIGLLIAILVVLVLVLIVLLVRRRSESFERAKSVRAAFS